MSKPVNDKLEALKVVPVVALPSIEAGLKLGEILINAGLPVAEVTFRTPCAADAIAAMKDKYPELLLLAGTVLTPEQADTAKNAGAECIVIPGFERNLVQHCLDNNIQVCPGTATPSEVLQCKSMGLDTVKFFPAEVAGGIPMLKAMSAVFSDMRFMPTGGVKPENVEQYLQLGSVLCCGGTWLASSKDMQEENWETIEQNVKGVVNLLNG